MKASLAVALVMAVLVSGARAGAANGLLVGQIVDGDSQRPVPDALVTLWPGSGGLALARTVVMGAPGKWPIQIQSDAAGAFAFADVPPGSYTITATKPGYVNSAYGMRRPSGSAMTLQLATGERRGDVRLLMWKYAALGGTVTDELGDPVVGVTVRAFRRADFGGGAHWLAGTGEMGPSEAPGVASATTDDRGVYRIGKLLPGTYIVAVPSTQTTLPLSAVRTFGTDGLSPALRGEINRAVSPTTFAFVFPGSAAAALTSTEPIAANSQIIGSSAWQVVGRLATPPGPTRDGHFFVYPTAFAAAASPQSGASAATLRSGEARSNIDINLTLAAAIRISGTIVGPAGPIGSVAVRLVPSWAEDFPNLNVDAASTVAEADGTFTMIGVPAGSYTWRVTRLGRPAANPPLPMLWCADAMAIGDKDLSDLRVVLRPGLHVSGRVEFEGATPRPVVGPYIYLLDADEAVTTNSMTPPNVAADWQFTTREVPAGKYFVRIGNATTPPGWTFKNAVLNGRDVSDAPLELNADAANLVVTFTDRPIRLSGTVRAADGAPDPDATVVLFTTDRQAWPAFGPSPRRLRIVQADAAGTFNVTDLPSGEYFVAAVTDDSVDDVGDTVRWLDGLSLVATKIQLGDGDRKTVELRAMKGREPGER